MVDITYFYYNFTVIKSLLLNSQHVIVTPSPGREDNASISGEFNFTDTTTTVVTAGRLLGEIQDGKTTFKPITLLLLDDCSGMSHETSLEDLVQVSRFSQH